MKLQKIKNSLSEIPALLALLVVTCIELIIALLDLQIHICRYRLTFGVWPALQNKKAENDVSKAIDREQAIRWILSTWSKKSNYIVAKDRKTFEATQWGRKAFRDSLDRHLYAVLRPTRTENLERIGNVLRAMDAQAFSRVMRNAKRIQAGKH